MKKFNAEKIIFDKFTGFRSAHSGGYTVSLAFSQFLVFDWIFFILAGYKDNHKSLDEFEFWRNFTTDCGVTREIQYVMKSCQ